MKRDDGKGIHLSKEENTQPRSEGREGEKIPFLFHPVSVSPLLQRCLYE